MRPSAQSNATLTAFSFWTKKIATPVSHALENVLTYSGFRRFLVLELEAGTGQTDRQTEEQVATPAMRSIRTAAWK